MMFFLLPKADSLIDKESIKKVDMSWESLNVYVDKLSTFFTSYLPQLYPKRRQKWALFGPPIHLNLSSQTLNHPHDS